MEILQSLIDWLRANAGITTALVVGSIVLLVASLAVGHYYLTSIPADYFTRRHAPMEKWRNARPALWWAYMIGKNLLGGFLVAIGLIMFLTPGQGMLTLLLGIALMDFPGKQRLERYLLQRPTVLKLVNRMRSRAGRPPLEFN